MDSWWWTVETNSNSWSLEE